jgi:hypothetical protein
LTLIILRDDHLPSAYPIVGVRPVTPSRPSGHDWDLLIGSHRLAFSLLFIGGDG